MSENKNKCPECPECGIAILTVDRILDDIEKRTGEKIPRGKNVKRPFIQPRVHISGKPHKAGSVECLCNQLNNTNEKLSKLIMEGKNSREILNKIIDIYRRMTTDPEFTHFINEKLDYMASQLNASPDEKLWEIADQMLAYSKSVKWIPKSNENCKKDEEKNK
jgi:hypothetical protein